MQPLTSIITLLAFLFASAVTAGGRTVACYHPDGRYCIETIGNRCCDDHELVKDDDRPRGLLASSECDDCTDVTIDLPIQRVDASKIQAPPLLLAFVSVVLEVKELQITHLPSSIAASPPTEDSRCAMLRAVIILC